MAQARMHPQSERADGKGKAEILRMLTSATAIFLLFSMMPPPARSMPGAMPGASGASEYLSLARDGATRYTGEYTVDNHGLLRYVYEMGAVTASYRSQGGGSWTVAKPSRIKPSTRNGVPASNSFAIYELDGQLLICASNCDDDSEEAIRTYYPRSQPDGDFIKLQLHKAGSYNSYWTLTTASGETATYKEARDRWVIDERRVDDTVVTFDYDKNPDYKSAVYLTRVVEGKVGAADAGHTATLISYTRHDDLGFGTVSARSGEVVKRMRLATRVEVRTGVTREGTGGNIKEQYALDWDTAPARPVLASITPMGSDWNQAREPVVFEYGKGARFGDPVRVESNASPTHYPPLDDWNWGGRPKRPDATLARYRKLDVNSGLQYTVGFDTFLDVDGDNLPDRVFYDWNRDAIRYQPNPGAGGHDADSGVFSFGSEDRNMTSWYPMENQLQFRIATRRSNELYFQDHHFWENATHVQMLDLDSDGALDFLSNAFESCDPYDPGQWVQPEKWVLDDLHDGDASVVWGKPGFESDLFAPDAGNPYPSLECLHPNAPLLTEVQEETGSGVDYDWFVDSTFADVNGDGLPDWIRSATEIVNDPHDREPNDEHLVYFNTGRRGEGVFGPAHKLTHGLGLNAVGGSYFYNYREVAHEYIDLNGDGLVDRFAGKNPFGNYPSDQINGVIWGDGRKATRGKTPTRVLRRNADDSGDYESSITALDILYREEETQRVVQDTFDIDGDGIPDSVVAEPEDDPVRIRVRRMDALDDGTGYVALDFSDSDGLPGVNDGVYLWRDIVHVTDIRSENTAITGSRFVDLNGDGLADWLTTLHYDFNNDGNTELAVRFNEGRPLTLLKAVGLGDGAASGRTKFDYTGLDYTQHNSGYAPNRLVVSRITQTNDLGRSLVAGYTYRDGTYDHATGIDFGFGRVIVQQPDGSVTETHYHVDTEIPAFRGRPVKVVNRAGPYTVVHNTSLTRPRPRVGYRTFEYVDLCAGRSADQAYCATDEWPAYTDGVGRVYPDEQYGRRPPVANRIVRKSAVDSFVPDVQFTHDGMNSRGWERRRVEYSHDDRGRVIIEDNLGVVASDGTDVGVDRVLTRYWYTNADGSVIDGDGIIDEYGALRLTSLAVDTLAYVADSLEFNLSSTDNLVRTKEIAYDEKGRPETEQIFVRNPLNGELEEASNTTWQYDTCGNVASVTDGEGHVVSFEYDPLYCSYMISREEPDTGLAVTLRTQYGYDTDGDADLADELMELHEVVEPTGKVTRVERDSFGRIIRVATSPDTLAAPTVEIQYPDNGTAPNRFRIVPQPGDGLANELVGDVDAFGALLQLSELTADGWRKRYQWNRIEDISTSGKTLDHRMVTAYAHASADLDAGDAFDRPDDPPSTATETRHWVTQNGVRIEQSITGGGLRSTTERIGTASRMTDPLGRVATKHGNPVAGTVQHNRFDANGDSLGIETVDRRSDRLRFTDAAGNQLVKWRDAANRVLRVSGPNLGTLDYDHDLVGNVVAERRPDGTTTTFEYDALDRLVRETRPDGSTIEWFRDGDNDGNGIIGSDEQAVPGRVTRVIDAAGDVTYTHTGNGRLASETRTIDDRSWTTAFTYDEFGRQKRVGLPNGNRAIKTAYRADGSLSMLAATEAFDNGTEAVRPVISSIGFDARGRVDSMTYGNGTVTGYAYHGASGDHRLARVDYPDIGGDTNLRWLTHDGAGNITEIDSSHDAHDRVFAYDSMDRLLAVDTGNGSALPTESFGFDLLDGNLTYMNDRTRAFGEQDAGPHALTDAGDGRDLEYDSHGNLIDRGDLRLAYNAGDRLVRTVDKTRPAVAAHAWSFGEGEGTTSADAVAGATASLGDVVWSQAGRLQYGLTLSGSTASYVELPAETLDGRRDFSVALWVKTTGDGDGLVSAANANNANEFLLYNQAALRLYLQGQSVDTGVNVADGRWHHLMVTRAASTVTLYVDGESVHEWTGAPTDPLQIDAGGLLLGQEQDAVGVANLNSSAQAYAGTLDELTIHDHAMTARAVRHRFVQQSATAHWSFSGGRNDFASDRIGNAVAALWGGSGPPEWQPARRGGGLTFAGTLDERVSLPNQLLDGAGDFAISLSLRTTGSGDGIVSVANSSRDNEFLLYDQGGLQIYLQGSVEHTSLDLADGEWHDLTVTRQDSTVLVYVDGELAHEWQNAPTAPLSVDAGGLLLAQEQDDVGQPNPDQPQQAYAGSLDEVRLDRRALTAAQVSEWRRPWAERPRAYWAFDLFDTPDGSLSGRALERIGGTEIGTRVGDVWPVSGVSGNAASFVGRLESFVELPTVGLDGVEAFTVSLWAKTTEGGDGLISMANADQANEFLLYDASSLRVYVKGASTNTGIDVADGDWHHLAVSRSGSTVTVYVDGRQRHVWRDAPSGAISVDNGGFLLGQEQDGVGTAELNDAGQAFVGALDEVRIHNGAMRLGEVRSLAAMPGLTGTPTRAAEYRYTYDHTGRRVKKAGPDGVTYYINRYHEERNGVPVDHYWFGSRRIASAIDGNFHWYHADHLGSTTLLTGGDGEPLRELRYSAYGEPVVDFAIVDGAPAPRYTYTGKERDGNGLMYYEARYYDPALGAFNRTDTIVDVNQPTLNGYGYAGGSPVVNNDPSGHGMIATTLIGAGIGGGAAFATTLAGHVVAGDCFDCTSTWENIGIHTLAGTAAGAVAAAAGGRYTASQTAGVRAAGDAAFGGASAGVYNAVVQGMRIATGKQDRFDGDAFQNAVISGVVLNAVFANLGPASVVGKRGAQKQRRMVKFVRDMDIDSPFLRKADVLRGIRRSARGEMRAMGVGRRVLELEEAALYYHTSGIVKQHAANTPKLSAQGF